MRRTIFQKVVSILLATTIMLQTVVPIAYAAGVDGHDTGVASLRQRTGEPLDLYLERVAMAQPELFQQAAMAAVQDAFNGVYGEDAPEDALEQQVAYYINIAVTQTLADPFGLEAYKREQIPEQLLTKQEPASTNEHILWEKDATDQSGTLEGKMTLASGLPADFDPAFRAIPQEIIEPSLSVAAPTMRTVGSDAILSEAPQPRVIAKVVSTNIPHALDAHKTIVAERSVDKLQNSTFRIAPQEPIVAAELTIPREFAPQSRAVTVDESTKDVDQLRVIADTINETATTFEATGQITLSVKITDTDTYTNYVSISGPNAKVSQDADGKITGSGTVRVRAADVITWTEIFTGDFGIVDAKYMTVSIKPADDTISTTIKEVGDFKLVGVAALSKMTLQDGGMSIAVQLDPASVGLKESVQKINTILTPDGEFTTPTADFTFTMVGLTITAKKINFTKKDGITSSEVEIKMPAALGGGVGTLESLKIADGKITINGGGVKFKLPDITFGGSSREISATEAVSKSLKITDIEVSLTVDKDNKVKVAAEGQLEIKMPSNDQKIKVSFEIDSSGDFEGTIDRISLTIAGNTLKMSKVKITNSGVEAETAKLIISAIKSANGQSLTGTVKKVAIKGNGELTFGEAGVKTPLPEFKIGKSVRFYEMVAELKIEGDGSGYSFEIKGKIDVTLPHNDSQTLEITASLDKEGKFSGEISELTIQIFKSTLEMKELKFDENSFMAKSAELTLPTILQGKKIAVENVGFNKDGLQMSDATIDIGDVTVGGPLKLKGAKITIARKDSVLSFTVEGTVELEGIPQKVGSSATGSLTLNTAGELSGKLTGLSLTLAGLTLAADDTNYENGVITAKKVRLVLPETWGGGGAEVNNLRVDDNGVSISGGKFELPTIKIGDIEMSLKGELEKISNGYRIKAEGYFKMPSTGAGGCAGIRVSVTIALTSNREVVMILEPIVEESTRVAPPISELSDAQAVDGFALENITVALEDCYIPVGTTGFGITKVSGSFTLTENVTKIELGITISSKIQISGKRAVDVNGNATFEQVKTPKKSELSITGAVEIFSMFKAAEAGVNLDFVNNRFEAKLNVRAVVLEGGIEFAAWESGSEFYLTGKGYMRIGIPKGAALNEHCKSIPYYWWGWKTKRVCTPAVPSSTHWLTKILVEAGRFSNNAWGAKAKVKVFGYSVGAYIDTDGNFSARNVDNYRLATGRDAVQARQLQLDLARGVLARSALSAEQLALVNGFSFAPNQTNVNFTVQHATETMIGFTHPPSGEVNLSLIAPNGLIITPQNIPGHVSFVTVSYPDPDIPEVAVVETVITVRDAYTGEWQLQIDADSNADDPYTLSIVGSDPGPQIDELRVVESAENQANLVYDIETAAITTTVSVYATLGPITETISFTNTEVVTNSRGMLETVTVSETLPAPNYDGIYLDEFVINQAARTRAIGNHPLDLSGLPSGDYYIWVTADDGKNHPTRQYATSATSLYGQAHVNHPWTPNWTAIVTPTIEHHGIDLVWEPSTNPDVDEYEVFVSKTENTPKEGDKIVPAGTATYASLTGLLPNQKYFVTVVGVDTDTGLVMDSQTLPLETIDAPFTMEASATDVTLISGGDPVTLTLTLNSNVTPYPEGIHLYAYDGDLSNASLVDSTFGDAFVTPTMTGTQTTLVIQAPTEAFAESNGQLIIEAFGAGSFVEVPINLTVIEPSFEIQSSENSITINEGDVVTVDLSAVYQDDEQDNIQLDIDAPYGLEHTLSRATLTPNASVLMTLTDTAELPIGVYDDYIDVIGWDGENERTTRIPLVVNKPTFELVMGWDGRYVDAFRSDSTGDFEGFVFVNVARYDWPHPIHLSVSPSDYISESTSYNDVGNDGETLTIDVDWATPLGIRFEAEIVATSNGFTKTLPVTIITRGESYHMHNILGGYEDSPIDATIVAGADYSIVPSFISKGLLSRSVVLTDTLGGDDPYVSVAEIANTDLCVADSGQMICDIGLGRYYPDGFPVTMTVSADAPQNHVIVHTVTAENTEPDYANPFRDDNSASVSLVVVRESDLAVEMTSTAATAGETIVYTATVVNNGPSYADDVEVSILPYDVDVLSVSGECTYEAGADVLCAVGDLALDESAIVTVTAKVPAYVRELVEADVLASSDSFDPSEEIDEYALLETPVQVDVTLDAVVEYMDGSLNEGELITFTVAITNAGPSEANEVTVWYAPPPELVLGGDGLVEFMTDGVVTGNYNFFDLEYDLYIGFLEPNESAYITLPMFVRDDTNKTRSNIVTNDFALWATEVSTETVSIDLELVNVAPTVEIVGGPTLEMREGVSLTLQALTNDVRRDVLTTLWDLDDDGQFDDATGNVVTFGGVDRDGDSTQVIHVKVMDDDGGENTATATIEIKNTAPMVQAGDDVGQQVKDAVNVAATFIELSPTDTHVAQIDWGDGTVEDVSLTHNGKVSGSHLYTSLGNFAVNVCVTDSDGAEGCDTLEASLSCVEHGATIVINSVETLNSDRTQVRVTFTVTNGSGEYIVPAGMKVTLYAGDTALHTTMTSNALAVGQSETFSYDWTDGNAGIYVLTARFNDDGTGTPTDALLCSLDAGVSRVAAMRNMSLPLSYDPVGTSDTYVGVTNSPVVVRAHKGLLANDSDPNNDTLTARMVSQPVQGSVLLQRDGGFIYIPTGGGARHMFTDETVTFTYAVSDGFTEQVLTATLKLSPSNASNADTMLSTSSRTLAYTETVKTSVIIPVGAITQGVTPTLKLYEVSPESVPAPQADPKLNHVAAGNLQAYLDGEAVQTMMFNKSVTVTINYGDIDLSDTDESTLKLYLWNGSQWIDAASTCADPQVPTLDMTENKLTVQICQTGQFSVQGTDKTPLYKQYLPLVLADSRVNATRNE